ncbi:hypothetical protein HAQ01_05230 [Acidithiobacillus thiooxidans]|uniref:Uncharacterized protein n=1 Tax=Acidithiobacillus sulfurivorans TaxID=1958756 RepID=A0ABS5ZX19_9PROT|nr:MULTISPECIES: hypothetical protein [Acidithiobacillus]MBU2759714.1 hypothetical protein [Acidithiobacillus sulfurivorans]MBU2792796.1 hypothetical protein [Acidithiobacillus thiooxidans]
MSRILECLRDALTPNMENMLGRGEVLPAMSRATKKTAASPLACVVCGHPVAFIKGKTGKPLCAACLTFSAKMPCVSDPGKPEKSRGLSPCNPKGGGMGLLVTPSQGVQFFVKEDKFDLVFLNTVQHTLIPFASVDHVLTASVEAVMRLPDGALYWWGMAQENDIYPLLARLRDAPWDIAQDMMRFHTGLSSPARIDTGASWIAVASLKKRPESVQFVKSVRRAMSEKDEKKRQDKLVALNEECPEAMALVSDLTEYALAASF